MANKNITNKRSSEEIKELSSPLNKDTKQLFDQALSTEDIIKYLKSDDNDKILDVLNHMEVARLDQDQPLVDALFNLLNSNVVAIKAKAIWLLGEIGMGYHTLIYPRINKIAEFLDDPKQELKVEAIYALTRISMEEFVSVAEYFDKILSHKDDSHPAVREAVAWSAMKVATYNPTAMKDKMNIMVELLRDRTPEVRKQTLQVFKEMAINRPQFVAPLMSYLYNVKNNDTSSLVSNEAKIVVKYIDNHTKVNTFIDNDTL